MTLGENTCIKCNILDYILELTVCSNDNGLLELDKTPCITV